MRFRHKLCTFVCVCMIGLMGITVRVHATPSISDFHDREPETATQTNQVTVAPDSTDGTNTSGILSESGIYINEAISDQYKETDENGNLVATDMSRMIDTAAATISETDENGKSIVDGIPTVTEILNNINPDEDKDYEKEYGYDPDKLDQLTYMLDFKYVSTDYRVIAGEKVHVGNKTYILKEQEVHKNETGRINHQKRRKKEKYELKNIFFVLKPVMKCDIMKKIKEILIFVIAILYMDRLWIHLFWEQQVFSCILFTT